MIELPSDVTNPLQIAKLELEQGVIPMIIRRYVHFVYCWSQYLFLKNSATGIYLMDVMKIGISKNWFIKSGN